VVPTHNRHQLLHKCLAAVARSAKGRAAELIIVDDGSQPSIAAPSLPADIEALLLRLEGEGPAAARNAGARAARGEIVLFTDDDTVPFPTWVAAALEYLDSHPNAVGVTGPIRSVAWDPLYEQSIEAAGAGHHWTCNIAYRRSVLEKIGWFRADVFAHAHAEDRDLAIRAMECGDIGFAPGMEVSHTPRRLALCDVARQARWARDDLTLYALHPQLTTDFALPVKLALVVAAGRTWLSYTMPRNSKGSIKRFLRAIILSVVGTTATGWAVLRTPHARVLRSKHGAHPS
jgi:GT2 family glycosyltransferase